MEKLLKLTVVVALLLAFTGMQNCRKAEYDFADLERT